MSRFAARQHLQEVTATVHDRLHRHPLLAPLSGEPVTDDGRSGAAATGRTLTILHYRAALAALFGFHEAAASVLAVAAEADPARHDDGPGPAALRLDLLRADLQVLGLSPAAVARLPRAWLPVPDSRPAVWGVRYVVDGSALGGRVIARSVAARLGLDAATGLAFFTGLGADTGAAWQALCSRLETELETPEARAAAAESALATFRRLEAWLDCRLDGLGTAGP